MPRKKSLDKTKEEILAALDVLEEYRALGVQFVGDSPRASGTISCYAVGREDRNPSAFVNVNTGRYADSGGDEGSLSLFDFAVRYGSFPDWYAALKHFADKAGVKLSDKRPENPLDKLIFEPWTPGLEQFALMWCIKHKKGATLEAIKAAGGRIVHYPCYFDKQTGEKRKGKHRCIALPAYHAEKLLDSDPACWVLWDIHGNDIEIYRGKDKEPDRVKMATCGPSHGALMNVHSLQRIGNDNVEIIYKTGGPSDMVALWSIIPPEKRDAHLVVCNASGEAGDVPPFVANVFAGKIVCVIHDSDKAGEVGAAKWLQALQNTAAEVWQHHLPYRIREKRGRDLRDRICRFVDTD